MAEPQVVLLKSILSVQDVDQELRPHYHLLIDWKVLSLWRNRDTKARTSILSSVLKLAWGWWSIEIASNLFLCVDKVEADEDVGWQYLPDVAMVSYIN